MRGVLIFDYSNDLVYSEFTTDFNERLLELAKEQGFIQDGSEIPSKLGSDVLLHIFSPLINSQRIMSFQFNNSYASIQLDNDFSCAFEEYLGYLIIFLGSDKVEYLQRAAGVCIGLAKRICGPNLNLLKTEQQRERLFTRMLFAWELLYSTNQAMLLETVEQLLMKTETRIAVRNALNLILDKLKQYRGHAILFVEGRIASIHSTNKATMLSNADLMFVRVLCHSEGRTEALSTHSMFFEGNFPGSKIGCIPCAVHCFPIYPQVILAVVVENGNCNIPSTLYEMFFAVHRLRNIQGLIDSHSLGSAYDTLESCVKQAQDQFKKLKGCQFDVEEAAKTLLHVKWATISKSYSEHLSSNAEKEALTKLELTLPKFYSTLKDLFTLMYCSTQFEYGHDELLDIYSALKSKLTCFDDIATVGLYLNGVMEQYFREFPGLVHFIHIDRSSGRTTTSGLMESNISADIDCKIRQMVDISRSYLSKGYFSMAWKDVGFNYTYFLWFEDHNGVRLKPKETITLHSNQNKPRTPIGVTSGNYYAWLIDTCFPKMDPNKVKCFELFCVHLGLVTQTCVLEHFRRISATINDVVGIHPDATDLL